MQIRPLALDREVEPIHLPSVDRDGLLCHSEAVLGHGTITDVRDVVVVDVERFDRSRSRETAAHIGRLNAELCDSATPYLLIGVGRWGSADPWLGIPVSWDQISGARAIVEAGLPDYRVSPSQGTHFFQNLTSFNIGYFTVNPEAGEGWVDWDWLASRPATQQAAGVRHLRFDEPLLIQMAGSSELGRDPQAGRHRARVTPAAAGAWYSTRAPSRTRSLLKRFEQTQGDGAGLAVADVAAVDADHGHHLGAGAGEEALVGRVEVVDCELGLLHGESGLAGETDYGGRG